MQAKGPRGTHKAFKVMRKKAVRFKSLTEEPPLQAFKFENVRALIPGRTLLFSPELSVEQAVSKAVTIVRKV